MNQTLERFARESIKQDLCTFPEDCQTTFKLMYGRNGGERSVEDAEVMGIDDVVDEIEPDKLDWAMQQIDGTKEQMEVWEMVKTQEESDGS